MFVLLAAAPAGCTDETAAMRPLVLRGSGAKVLAVQSPGEAWQEIAIPLEGATTISIVDGPFVVTSVCEYTLGIEHDFIFGGPGMAEVDAGCRESPASSVDVSVPASATFSAAVGRVHLPPGTSWEFEPGHYDVLAYAHKAISPRIEIRRNVSIASDTVLSFDLALSGEPLETFTVTTDATAVEQVDVSSTLETAGGGSLRMSTYLDPDGALRVPASSLRAGDRQTVTAEARDIVSARSATRHTPAEHTLALPLPPGVSSANASWGPSTRVDWETAGTWTSGRIVAWDIGHRNVIWAKVSEEWVAAMGVFSGIELPLTSAIDGWQPRWSFPTVGVEWDLTLEHRLSDHEIDRATHRGYVGASVAR